jgi:hypothetical protein
VWQTEHTAEAIQDKERSRRELSERLDVGRPEMFGGFNSEHFWIEGQRLRAARRRPSASPSRALLVDSGGVDHEQCTEPAACT